MGINANIDTLKSTLNRRGGLAKANRFAVYITHPGGKNSLVNTDISSIIGNAATSVVQGGSFNVFSFFNDPRDMYLLCESVNLPGRQILTQEYTTGQRTRKKPYNYVTDDVNMTFNLTNDYMVFEYFRTWMDLIVPEEAENHYSVAFKDRYATDITIQQIATQDYIPAYQIKLRNAFPITLNSVQLSNAGEGTVAQCSVTFAYDEWERMDLIDGYKDMFNRAVGKNGILSDTLGTFGI